MKKYTPNKTNPEKDTIGATAKDKIKFYNKISYFLIALLFGLNSICDIAIQFFFKNDLQLEPATFAQIQTLIKFPWMIKPIYGLLSDRVPIFGYRRKYYIIFSGITATLSWLAMSFLVTNLFEAIIVMTCLNGSISFLTVLGEAVVVELSKLDKTDNLEDDSHSDAKSYVSYFFMLKNMGALIAACFQGVIVKYFSLSTVFLMASLLPTLAIISGVMLIENKCNVPSGDNSPVRLNSPDSCEDTDIETTTSENISHEYTKKNGCKVLFNFMFQKRILLPAFFMVLFMATPSYDYAMLYFFTEELKLDAVDLGYVSLASTLSIIVAIVLYRIYFKNLGFKKTIIAGTLVYILFSFSAYLLVTRDNLLLGIPDLPLIITSSSILSMIGEIIMMPLLALAAILSPKDFEGTAYSVFMASFNIGIAISGLSGSFLTSLLGITKEDYHNLKWLVFIANVSCFLPLPFLFFLESEGENIPSTKQEKDIEFVTIVSDNDLHKRQII
jgi:Na+/melibiose symporter-like transporter